MAYIAIASGSPCVVPSDENKCLPSMALYVLIRIVAKEGQSIDMLQSAT